jgi:hypothetical protein
MAGSWDEMAKMKQSDTPVAARHRAMSKPGRFILNMLIFVIIVAMVAALIWPTIKSAVLTNLFLNGLIIGVFIFGILYCFLQVLRLYPEIRWINDFRVADPGLSQGPQPKLLSPMATMLRDRRGTLSLSTTAMRSLMDSIGARLDEARDTGRYLVGLLVFLGLLGTFWGLLDTISQVGKTIGALDTKGGDSTIIFQELKDGLAAPLKGMGTAFSASLLGLSGSLILGFLELQASHASARFYNELEEWLSGITDLSPAGAAGSELGNRQLMTALYDVQQALVDLSQKLGAGVSGGTAGAAVADENVRNLASGVDQLVRQMRVEQQVVRQWVDEQSAQQSEVAAVMKDLAQTIQRGPR